LEIIGCFVKSKSLQILTYKKQQNATLKKQHNPTLKKGQNDTLKKVSVINRSITGVKQPIIYI